MVSSGPGLSDNQRAIASFIIYALITISATLAALPEEQRPPIWVVALLGTLATIAGAGKAVLGVRDSSTSAVARTVDPAYPQFRTVDKTETGNSEKSS